MGRTLRPEAGQRNLHHLVGKIVVLSIANSSVSGTCSIAKVNVKVTGRVICVFMHRSPSRAGQIDGSSLRSSNSLLLKRLRKRKKEEKNLLPELQETVASLFIIESAPTPLYLLENTQSGKSENFFFIPQRSPRLEENSLSQLSTYLRNIQTGKSKKLFLFVGKVPGWWGNLDHSPLLI
jgi:hypothetical protein